MNVSHDLIFLSADGRIHVLAYSHDPGGAGIRRWPPDPLRGCGVAGDFGRVVCIAPLGHPVGAERWRSPASFFDSEALR